MSDTALSVAEAARAATSVEQYDAALFEAFGRDIGFDVAFCIRQDGPSRVAPGLEERVRRDTAGRWALYGQEFSPVAAAAARANGVAVDREVFGTRALERTRTFQEVMRPHAGTSTLLTYLTFSGVRKAVVVFGRSRGAEFTDRERSVMERASGLLCLCEYAVGRLGAPDPLASLTPREREVVKYLCRGYTNRDIALACGTAPRTVRNQLSSVFEKLGASTRAEVVAIALAGESAAHR